MLAYLPLTMMGVMLPLYMQELGGSPLAVTGLFSILPFALLLFRPIAGRLADKAGMKKIIFAGLLLYAVSYGCYAMAQSVALLYIGRVLQGLAAAFMGVATYLLVSKEEQQSRSLGKISGFKSQSGLYGVVLALLIMSNIAFGTGWQRFFLLCTAAGAAGAVLLWKSKEISQAKPIQTEKTAKSNGAKAACVLNFALSVFTGMLGAIFILYVQHRFHPDMFVMTAAFFLPLLVTAYGSKKLGEVAHKLGVKKGLPLALILSAVALVATVWADSIYLFAVLWTLYNVFFTIGSFCLDSVLTKELSGFNGALAGEYTTWGDGGAVIGPLIGGLLIQGGFYTASFWVCAGAFALVAAGLKLNGKKSVLE